jgi:5'-AMP-activated protein kinase catalytic alpha subunit
VHSALLSGDPHDQLAIAYHLIVDNKRIADEAAKAELRGLNSFIDQLFLKFLFFFVMINDLICFCVDFYIAGSPPPAAFSPGDCSPTPGSGGIKPHPERIARNLKHPYHSSSIASLSNELLCYIVFLITCSWVPRANSQCRRTNCTQDPDQTRQMAFG